MSDTTSPFHVITVIRKNFVDKKFSSRAKGRNIFLRKIFLLVIIYMMNIWHAFDMNENLVTRKFLTYFANKSFANYGITQADTALDDPFVWVSLL